MPKNKTYEYEERAFLSEDNFGEVKEKLEARAISSWIDNKVSYFFVLPDDNVSIASSPLKTVVKYKNGQLGKGNGFEEHEFTIKPESLPSAIELFTSLLKGTPQVSEQFRINYILENGIEVALKYTHTWGFHLEIEKVYTVSSDGELDAEKSKAQSVVEKFADELNVSFISDNEMDQFKRACVAGESRGSFTPEEFKIHYGELFGF